MNKTITIELVAGPLCGTLTQVISPAGEDDSLSAPGRILNFPMTMIHSTPESKDFLSPPETQQHVEHYRIVSRSFKPDSDEIKLIADWVNPARA